MRWTAESCLKAAKGEVRLNQYKVRPWTGWHCHIILVMLAHAYLAVPCTIAVREIHRDRQPQSLWRFGVTARQQRTRRGR